MSHCKAVLVVLAISLAVVVQATTPVAPPAPLEIAASSNGRLHWKANGKALPADGTIVVPPGQTLNFKGLDGTHGVGFVDGSIAKKLFRVITGQFKDNPPQGKSGSWGTQPASPSLQPLAVLQVSKEAKSGTLISFFCTQHGTPPVAALKVRSVEEGNVLSAKEGCAAGQPGPCELLAEYYEKGGGVPKDESRAASLYRKGCDLHDSVSCYNLGVMYIEGRGVPRSNPRAVSLFEKVCATPDMVGMGCSNLAFMYLDGLGVAKDEARAAALFKRGCDEGEALSCVNLGTLYRDGRGVEENAVRAVALLRSACERPGLGPRDWAGCGALAYMYANGLGIARDEARATALHEKACNEGDPRSCGELGFRYHHGRGVPRDAARAVAFYKRACDAGDGYGCGSLGMMYRHGQGIPKDEVRALALLRKGCAGGFGPACEELKQPR